MYRLWFQYPVVAAVALIGLSSCLVTQKPAQKTAPPPDLSPAPPQPESSPTATRDSMDTPDAVPPLQLGTGLKTEYVVLVTTDGLRPQELFHGADPALMDEANAEHAGIKNLARLRERFWRDDPDARRRALMPFFWGELAPRGIVLGDSKQGSTVTTRNPLWFSYPGYAELLAGAPQPEIKANNEVWNPSNTVMQIVRDQLGLPFHKVATVASWKVIRFASMNQPEQFFVNAGYDIMADELLDPEAQVLNRTQNELWTGSDRVRHDVVTAALAMSYLRKKRPRLYYIGFGETDDWAHRRRYDRTLQAAHYFDSCLRQLWTALQSMEPYRGRTTLIITTDHGRGRGLEDWVTHNSKTPGAGDIWIAVIGPDTPDRGALTNTGGHSLSQVAPTILRFFGVQTALLGPDAVAPILEAFGQ